MLLTMANPKSWRDLSEIVRTRETDLIAPALTILAQCEEPRVGVTAANLRAALRAQIKPFPADLEKLSGRNDDRLSQVLRNLTSHRTLQRTGLATYYRDPVTNEGFYRLTDLGLETMKNRTPA